MQNGDMSGWKATDEQARILRFWWLLELFSPQKIPARKPLSPNSPNERVSLWRPNDPLPWNELDPPKRLGSTERVWSHTVYLGVYSLADIYESLHRVFQDDADVYDVRPPGQSACAGLLIDDRGQLVIESQILSSALWAVGRATNQGSSNAQWAEGFESARSLFAETVEFREAQRIEEFIKSLSERDSPPDEDVPPPPPIEGDFICELLKIAHRYSGITGHDRLATDGIIIKSTAVSARKADESGDTDFLNSFFLDDLSQIQDQSAEGELGEALSSYLTRDDALPANQRIDVRDNPSAVDSEASIDHLPKGRWPSSPSHHLALSQQFAVNQALGKFASGKGIMGVNGPPGTGKTTMLRDILAGNVVERAKRLTELAQASDAFTGTGHTWNVGEKSEAWVPQLKPELTGFEMIVASANNSAVENISFEIPMKDTIAEQWRDSADYFSDIATFLLQRNSKSKTSDVESTAWGTVAARLGNKSNRKSFRSDFWFGERDPKTNEPVEGGCIGLAETLWRRSLEKAQLPSWSEAKYSFIQAESRVDRLIEEAKSAKDRLSRVEPARFNVQRIEHKLEQNRTQMAQVQQSLSQFIENERETTERRDYAFASYKHHLQAKPNLFEVIWSWGRALRHWREALNEFSRRLLANEDQLSHIVREREHLQIAFHEKAEILARTEKDLKRARVELKQLVAQCSDDEAKYGKSYPGEHWTGEARELQAPWLNEELDEARSELFFEALKLHENFMVSAGKDIRVGLKAAVAVVGANHPAGLSSEKLVAAWQLFFLAVPLVSTTFAAAGRMFDNLGKDSLGWLFIDEAGQAAPQYAAGSIWRAQRVIAVGDPLQLEPVVTIPNKAQGDIAKTLRISNSWRPPAASVQTLADRISIHGTTLTQDGEDVWVSAPLRVHRRCDDPMFSISNQIAYEGIMVNGVHRKIDDTNHPDLFDRPDGYRIYPSFWADEPAPVSGSHLQINQIERLRGALNYLGKMGVDYSDVIAISPFRDVAEKLTSLNHHYPGLTAGTIHTAQGREASVVFFVLGGDPSKPGAKAWAAQSVNLVNVAISRAKRRLYVIGDESAWAKNNFFRQLSHGLSENQRVARKSTTA